jgi:tetratricopeptide (TPR) repeat protein
LYADARRLYEAAGDALGVARETLDLAYTHAMTGEYDTARELFEDALQRSRDLDDEFGIQDALFMGGYTDLLSGRLDDAERALEEVLTLMPPDSMRRQDAMIGLGQVRRKRGDVSGARQALGGALTVLGETRDVGSTIGVAEVLGATDVEIGDPEAGLRLLAAGQALRERTGSGPPAGLLLLGEPFERARETLGQEPVEAAIAKARALDVETLLASVVEESKVP